MSNNNKILKLVKFIDYIYLNYYVKNSLNVSISDVSISDVETNKNMNNWKIFSTRSNDVEINKINNVYLSGERLNILYLLQMIISQDIYDFEVLLISLHIYKKICIQYAHLIDNYTYLFGCVYIVINKILCKKFLTENFLSNMFGINPKFISMMIHCVDEFIDTNDIYFGTDEKHNILDGIYHS